MEPPGSIAVDVGQGQLAWKLRQDPRVVVMERTNARNLTPAQFPPPFHPLDLAVIDCSFISLRKILPPAVALLRPCARHCRVDQTPVRSRQSGSRQGSRGDT